MAWDWTHCCPRETHHETCKAVPCAPKAAEKASTDEKVESKAEVKVAAKETKEKEADGDGDADVGTLNKRLKDTRDYATKLGQENKELKSPTLLW